jgi:hypothetical protein
MEDIPVEFWETDYKSVELKSLKGKVKYYKSREREVWFDKDKNVIKEFRFWQLKLRYRYFAEFQNQQIVKSYSIYYEENGIICNEDFFSKTPFGQITNFVSYCNYPEIGDYGVTEKFETIKILDEYAGIKFRSEIEKTSGQIECIETKYFDVFDNMIGIDSQHWDFVHTSFLINCYFFVSISQFNFCYNLNFEYTDKTNDFYHRLNFNVNGSLLSFEGKMNDFYIDDILYTSNHETNHFKNVKNFKINNLQVLFNEKGLLTDIIESKKDEIFYSFKLEYNEHFRIIKSTAYQKFGNRNKKIEKDFINNRKIITEEVFRDSSENIKNENILNQDFIEEIIVKTLDDILISETEIINNEVVTELFYFPDGTIKSDKSRESFPKDLIERDENGNIISITSFCKMGKSHFIYENDVFGNLLFKLFFLNEKYITSETFDIEYF